MGSFAEGVQTLSIEFVPFIMAVVCHEYAHGFVAHRWGDKTALKEGRLTLNPIPHMDLLGTLILPVAGMLSGMNLLFGWAKPVPIDPRQFKKLRPGLFCVAIAGPTMNVVLAFLSAFSDCAIRRWVPPTFYLFEPLVKMAGVSVILNYFLGIFNLIPIPPLDGSKILESFLPLAAAQKYETLARYSSFLLLALIFSGALSILSYPVGFCSDVTIRIANYFFGGFTS